LRLILASHPRRRAALTPAHAGPAGSLPQVTGGFFFGSGCGRPGECRGSLRRGRHRAAGRFVPDRRRTRMPVGCGRPVAVSC